MKLREGEYVPATCQVDAPRTRGALLLVCQRVLQCQRCHLCLVHCTCVPPPPEKKRRKRGPDERGRFVFEDASDSPNKPAA